MFEWREDMFEPLQQGVRKAALEGRVTVIPFNLKTPELPEAHYDGLVSFDDLGDSEAPPELAKHLLAALKPGARIVVEAFAFEGAGDEKLRTPGQLVSVLREAGFNIEARDDLSHNFLMHAQQGFKGLSARLAGNSELQVQEVQEIATEAGNWRKRMSALAQKRMQRWRIVGRRKEAPVVVAEKKKAAPKPKLDLRQEVTWKVKPDNSLDVLQKVLSDEERKAERARLRALKFEEEVAAEAAAKSKDTDGV